MCAIGYATGMSFSGVREDHSVLLASGPSLVAVWKGDSYGLLGMFDILVLDQKYFD